MIRQRKSRQGGDYLFLIPEREEILEFLKRCKKPRKLKHIAEALGLDNPEQWDALSNRLKAMVRDGQLIRNRRDGYGLLEKMDLIAGRVIGHPDGYGFLVRDDGEKDLYLPEREMRSLLHGDRAAVRIVGIDRKGKPKAVLVEVLERANDRIVGSFVQDGPISFVIPDNKRLHQDIFIPGENRGTARPGQFVVVKLVKQPDRHTQPVGEIIEVLGDATASGMATEIAIRAYELPHEWPQEVQQEIASINGGSAAEIAGRVDLRACSFVTIDGEDARDFDDAVYCEKVSTGWRLLVAIADVSHYVQPDTALDREAERRGTSVYFPQRVVPMLPELLSNDLCSLKPGVDRLCMVCELQLDKQANVTRYKFYQGIIRSAARLTYTEVAGMLIDRDVSLLKRHAVLLPRLEELYALFKNMNKRRRKHGLLDFDATEAKLVFDDEGKVTAIESLMRNDAHRLIEEFMLAANIAAADFLLHGKIPVLYRNHETPTQEKISTLHEFLAEFGLSLGGGEQPDARDYAALLETVRTRGDAHLIETVLLRSMPLASYGEKNLGHFGLAFEAYTHFTSPIRRYPDLLVHRAVRHLLTYSDEKFYPYTSEGMAALGESCSMTERRAEEATRDVIQRLKCNYMQDKVGEIFSGSVSSVTGFGLFVELDEMYIEGLIHVTSLPNDYYHFDAVGHRLQGERTGKVYRLANRVRVKVVRVNVEDRKIDFELLE
ncbi:MAG: ribonuclease R [Gammaproteobacteria bacterium]